MKNSTRIGFLMILAVGCLSACAGGRQKQAVSVQPAPGATKPAADPNGNQQAQPGGQSGEVNPGPETEQGNPNTGGGQLENQPPGSNKPGTSTAQPGTGNQPGAGNQNNNATTDLSIEATLDNGVASEVAWDGKSFKGSGKWKVEPMP